MNIITALLFSFTLLASPHLSGIGDLTITPYDGDRAIQMKHFTGEVVIVDFWATWCPPCRVELPKLHELVKTYKNKPVRLVACSLDKKRTSVMRFLKKKKLPGDSIYMVNGKDTSRLGIKGLPTTLLLDTSGRIIKSWSGFAGSREITMIKREIDRLLVKLPKQKSTEV